MARGGRNKTHDCLERYARLDAFEIVNAYGMTLAGGTALDYACEEMTEHGMILRFSLGEWEQAIELATNNNTKSVQTFFVCPSCGARKRYLYLKNDRFLCRSCQGLNYQTQQATKDSLHWAKMAWSYAEKHLQYDARARCAGDLFNQYLWPTRPKGMRKLTYKKKMIVFCDYVERYRKAYFEEAEAIIEKAQKGRR